MNEIEVTFGRAAQVWWSYCWRSTLMAILLGAAIGFLLGIVGAVIGVNLAGVTAILCAAVGILVSIYTLQLILKKKFSPFRIALIANDP